MTTAALATGIAIHQNKITLAKSTYGGAAYDLLIDGVAWARMYRSSHGMHGHTYAFHQIGDDGEIVRHDPKAYRGYHSIAVKSHSKREHKNRGDERPTEQRIIDTARELIAEGLLRHPLIVKEEHERETAAYRKSVADAKAKEEADFRTKARQAFQGHDIVIDDPLIDSIVAAMRWAQTQ